MNINNYILVLEQIKAHIKPPAGSAYALNKDAYGRQMVLGARCREKFILYNSI